MKLKINILLKSIELLLTIAVFILGFFNIFLKYPENLQYISIILSCTTFVFYLVEWTVTRAWFRIAYWLAFVIINPIMLMDKDQTKIIRNINASMFIFSIFYLIIMLVSLGVLIYTYVNRNKEKQEEAK